jgi:hypothetical protein
VHQLPENKASMKVPDVVLPGLNVRGGTSLFLVALLLPIACVTLDKPPQVAKCAAENTCNDDFVPPDDKDAAVAPEDTRVADEPMAPKADLGPDSPTFADTLLGKTDVSTGKLDVWGPEASASEVLPPADTRVPTDQPLDPGDTRIDTVDAPSGDDVEKQDVIREDLLREDLLRDDVIFEDVVKQDVPGPETPRDIGSADVPATACPAVNPVSGGNIAFGTKSAVCFVTCDVIKYGWGCSSFDDSQRTIKVNGQTVKCAGTLPAQKQPGNYYYFEISAGGNTWDAIHWSGDMVDTCPTPSGGFVP